MKTRKTLKTLALATLLATTAFTATRPLAQTPVAAAQDMARGEVRKIDKDSQKITLKHGEIKNLDMPPMTMVFKALDPTLLDKVKVGDKVQFQAVMRDGAMVVTTIELAQ